MNPASTLSTHAARIVQAGASLNSLDSAVRYLATLQTKDKKLQGAWTELRRLARSTYARLVGKLDGPTGDYINEVSNQAEQLLTCLCYLPADQRRKLVSQAEDMANAFAVAGPVYELNEEAVTE